MHQHRDRPLSVCAQRVDKDHIEEEQGGRGRGWLSLMGFVSRRLLRVMHQDATGLAATAAAAKYCTGLI